MAANDLAQRRLQMVERQLRSRRIVDEGVLSAMASVPRHSFLPSRLASIAYDDAAVSIAAGQTMSQPYVVALMAEAAEIDGDDRVLEVGTGSGYGAAVLATIAGEVWTVERHSGLARRARSVLAGLGFDNVRVVDGDGTLGWSAAAPFDAIVVTAGGPDVPPALTEQLAEGGRLVIPVGADRTRQHLVRIAVSSGVVERVDFGAVRFVPLIGEQGW